MIANYHTHTWRCMHATGTEREYIENAIRGGLKILGFSDHTPMKYPGGYESKAKMRPDLLNFIGDEQIYDQWMRKLCLSAKEMNIPLEINFLGIRDKRNYPNSRFWKIAGEVGNRVVFGADAHQPEVVWNPETISVAENMVRKYHLNLVETIEFKHTDRLNRK